MQPNESIRMHWLWDGERKRWTIVAVMWNGARKLSQFVHVHHTGAPTGSDVRQLLRVVQEEMESWLW